VLLPINYGGGSNVKTAEAISAGCKIVATPHAFRGFEAFKTGTNIALADTSEEFCSALDAALSPSTSIGHSAPPLDIMWENTLRPLTEFVGQILGQVRSLA
jgi:hypothetical protein